MIFKKIANILTELFYILLNFAKIKSFLRPNFAKLNKKQVNFCNTKKFTFKRNFTFLLKVQYFKVS